MTANILCVDDEPLIRMMLAETLVEIGYTVVEASSGEEAIQLHESMHFDALITDIRMGGISGWELADRLRTANPGLPVIYISGYCAEQRQLPDSVFIPKPFLPRDMHEAVRAILPPDCEHGANA